MRRPLFLGAIIALCPVVGLLAWIGSPGRAQPARTPPDEPARKRVPLTQVVLFNTGVGYFQREGVVEGNARIDLTFLSLIHI